MSTTVRPLAEADWPEVHRIYAEGIATGHATFEAAPPATWVDFATGKLDAHFTALWDHGHIKFWSAKTLSQLFAEVGFVQPTFEYCGRMYPLSKSMIAVARKPAASKS